MKISIKYGLYLALVSLIETLILRSFKEHFVVYSPLFFMLLTYSLFMIRLIYIDSTIFKYLKNSQPEIYEKLSSSLFGIRLMPRSVLVYNFVIDSLDDRGLKYFKEYKILKRCLIISFVLFAVFCFMVVGSYNIF